MKIISPLGLGARLLAALIGLMAVQATASAAVLGIQSTFDGAPDAGFYGMAFKVEGGVSMLYAADLATGKYVGFNSNSGTSVLSITTNNYTWGAGVGIGDFSPEYYLSTADGRTMRYNANTSQFVNTFYGPGPILGVESSDPYLGYQSFWAVDAINPNVWLLSYAGAQQILQTITVNGATGLTDLAVGLNGSLYILGGSTIYQYTTAGAFVTTFDLDPAIANPRGIAYDTETQSFLISNGTATIYRTDAIPEPGVVTLALFGLGAMFVLQRMRKARTA